MTKTAIVPNAANPDIAPSVDDVIKAPPKWSGGLG